MRNTASFSGASANQIVSFDVVYSLAGFSEATGLRSLECPQNTEKKVSVKVSAEISVKVSAKQILVSVHRKRVSPKLFFFSFLEVSVLFSHDSYLESFSSKNYFGGKHPKTTAAAATTTTPS